MTTSSITPTSSPAAKNAWFRSARHTSIDARALLQKPMAAVSKEFPPTWPTKSARSPVVKMASGTSSSTARIMATPGSGNRYTHRGRPVMTKRAASTVVTTTTASRITRRSPRMAG
jgi:hypothetical protein